MGNRRRMRRSLAPWVSTVLLAAGACTHEGDVFTTIDGGSPAPDATVPIDAGTPDAGHHDAGIEPTEGPAWSRLPGLHGGQFRYLGASGSSTYLSGRRLDETQWSVYRLGADGSSTKLSYPGAAEGRPAFAPIGALIERGGRLLWATERDGIVASQDGGESWAALSIPGEDGSVGDGNGHDSRILNAWSAGQRYCVHSEVTPWVDYVVRFDELHGEVRCLEDESWTVVTSSLADGVRHISPFGRDLYGFTAPLYNQENEPRLCHSADLGASGRCSASTLHGSRLGRTASGRLVAWRGGSTEEGVFTEVWVSDDHGQTFELALTVPALISEQVTIIGEALYGVPYQRSVRSVVSPIQIVQLAGTPRLTTGPKPTEAQPIWMDVFGHDGALHAADTRGVRRYSAAEELWSDLALEPMPALALMTDNRGAVLTIDGSRAVRRLRPGRDQWDEHFFDDTGWATADVTHHASVYTLGRLHDTLFFGAGHRKLYLSPANAPTLIPMEDQTLTSVLHPSATVVRMASSGAALFLATTAGEEVNHGTGARIPWGGGLYRRRTTGEWSDASAGLPVRTVGGISAPAVVTAIHADSDTVVVATQAGVFRSVNGGASWTNAGGVPIYDAGQQATVIAGRAERVLLVRQSGPGSIVYFSADSASSFITVGTNLPAGATVQALAAASDGFYALVQPGGVYRSEDDGRSWAPVGNTTDPRAFERPYALLVEEGRILVASSQGVFQLDRDVE